MQTKTIVNSLSCPGAQPEEYGLTRVDYYDAYSCTFTSGEPVSMDALGKAFFKAPAGSIRGLMYFRDLIVKAFGLKISQGNSEQSKTKVRTIFAGSQTGIFKVLQVSDSNLLLGQDDSHLNFRVCFVLENSLGCGHRRLKLSTAVQFNNTLGRLYFFIVRPFHKLIVPVIMRRMIRQLAA